MKDKIKIPCPYCQGEGIINLTDVYVETLTAMMFLERPSTTADLLKCLPDTETSQLCNRLARLAELGLVKRMRRIGKYISGTCVMTVLRHHGITTDHSG